MPNLMKKCLIRLISNFYKRDPQLWVFGEWFGSRVGDNTYAFLNYILSVNDSITPVWICKKNTDTSMLPSRVKIVASDSDEAVSYLKKAGVAIMNQGIADLSTVPYNYLGNAIKVNLWHGIMWKKIGHDYDDKHIKFYKTKTLIEDYLYKCDIYECPSEIYQKYIISAFNLKKNNTIFAGLPRNQIFYYPEKISEARNEIIQEINRNHGYHLEPNIKIITYMPTFRDKGTNMFSFNTCSFKNELEEFLSKENAVLIQKAHFADQSKVFSNSQNRSRIINANELDAQKLLASSQILITDYSSCLFDFSILDRPIIQFLYDYDYYCHDDRGLYYPKEEIDCGNIAMNENDLFPIIQECLENPSQHIEKLKIIRSRFLNHENISSCQTIYQLIVDKLHGKLSTN